MNLRTSWSFFFFFIYKFIYLFIYLLAALGLHCCTRAFSSCGSWALERRLSSCGARAYLLCGMRDLPGPGFETTSPALTGGFLTTAPPGKSHGPFSSVELIKARLVTLAKLIITKVEGKNHPPMTDTVYNYK